MDLFKRLSLLVVAGVFAGAQQLPDDPVMKARAQRAQAQGISEADLPPVPRGVLEPPPLPAPELHLKDARGGRAGKAHGKALSKAQARALAKAEAKAGHAKVGKGPKHPSKHPLGAAKKPGRTKKKVKV